MTSTPLFKPKQQSNVGYPEVTLHPIQSTSAQFLQNQKFNADVDAVTGQHSNSLLHGILTKVIMII